jgi:hypothetical protein
MRSKWLLGRELHAVEGVERLLLALRRREEPLPVVIRSGIVGKANW